MFLLYGITSSRLLIFGLALCYYCSDLQHTLELEQPTTNRHSLCNILLLAHEVVLTRTQHTIGIRVHEWVFEFTPEYCE